MRMSLCRNRYDFEWGFGGGSMHHRELSVPLQFDAAGCPTYRPNCNGLLGKVVRMDKWVNTRVNFLLRVAQIQMHRTLILDGSFCV